MTRPLVVTPAVVLAKGDEGESTVRVEFFTDLVGRLTGRFKKARWGKIVAVSPGAWGNLIFRETTGSGPVLIIDYEPTGFAFKDDLPFAHFWALETVIEALVRLLPPRDPYPALFQQVVELFRLLPEARYPIAPTVTFFMNAISLLGYPHRLEACLRCGRGLTGETFLVPGEGGIRCLSCGGRGENGITLSKGGRIALANLSSLPLPRAATVNLAPQVTEEVLSVLSILVNYYFDRDLNSFKIKPLLKAGR